LQRCKASIFAGIVLAHVTGGPECDASEDDEPIGLAYTAHAGCPSEREMLRRIRAYTTRWRYAAPGEDARRFVLRIDRHGKTFAGHLDLLSRSTGDGSIIRREIEGDDCNDVATGLAVAVAMAIDPGARATEEPQPPIDDPATSESATPQGGAVLPDAPTRPEMPSPKRPPPTPRPRTDAAEPFAVSIGARLELTSAVSGALPLVAGFVEMTWPAPTRLPWLAPTVRVGARQSFARTSTLGSADISILWSAGFVELCPGRMSLGTTVLVNACITANAGVVSAEARGAPGAETAYRAWLDYGATVGVRWRIHAKIFVEIVGGVAVPITRDRFRVEPDGAAVVAPRAGGIGGIGSGWRF